MQLTSGVVASVSSFFRGEPYAEPPAEPPPCPTARSSSSSQASRDEPKAFNPPPRNTNAPRVGGGRACDPPLPNGTDIWDAAKRGDHAAIARFVNRGANLDAVDKV